MNPVSQPMPDRVDPRVPQTEAEMQALAYTVSWHEPTYHDPRPGWCEEDTKWWNRTTSVCSHPDHIGRTATLGYTAPEPPHAPICAIIGPDRTLVNWHLMYEPKKP